MSIVGPRPALPREVEQYNDYQKQGPYVTPGLTCYWQILPHRNETTFDEWMDLDIQYIQERSFLTDWKIIFKTVGVVLRGGVENRKLRDIFSECEGKQMPDTYKHKVDKSKIPTCTILGVDLAAINMDWLLKFTEKYIDKLKGDYMTVVNVYSCVSAYEDPEYCEIQNRAIMAMPDGGPLSTVGRKRGYKKMERTTGPSYMGEILKISADKGYKHSVTCY